MKQLTKGQKAIIVLSVFWALVCLIESQHRSLRGYTYVRWDDFFVPFFPVILYWSGVWIWGFGYVVNSLKKIRDALFGKKMFSILLEVGKILLKIAIVLLVLSFIVATLDFFSGETSSGKTGNIELTPEIEEVVFDYGMYYGLFVSQDEFCKRKGYKLKNLSMLRKKYQTNIQNLENKFKNTKDSKGQSLYDIFVVSKKMREKLDNKALEGFFLYKKAMIGEKLLKTNPLVGMAIMKNLSSSEILPKYGHLVPDREVCKNFDETIPETLKDENNPFTVMLKFFDKYN